MLTYEEIFPSYEVGSFLKEIPARYKLDFEHAHPDHWGYVNAGSWSS
jgi:hypothetical protein